MMSGGIGRGLLGGHQNEGRIGITGGVAGGFSPGARKCLISSVLCAVTAGSTQKPPRKEMRKGTGRA